MSLSTNVANLATRISTECKALRTLINGNAIDLSSLTTTSKTNLVSAINELDAAVDAIVGGATTLNDLSDVIITTAVVGNILRHNGTNWVNTADTIYQPADGDLTSIAALTTTSYGRAFLELANQAALLTLIGAATSSASGVVELATTVEAVAGVDTVRAVTPAGLQAAINALVASAPGTLDTLNELATALGNDPNFATTIATSLAGKQPIDSDLTAIAALISAADKLPYATGSGTWALADITAAGRALIDDADAATQCTTLGVGDTTVNFVTTFEAGLT